MYTHNVSQALLKKCYTDDTYALAVAKVRLSTHFAVVGIVERMDETLSLLDHCFATEIFGAQTATGGKKSMASGEPCDDPSV